MSSSRKTQNSAPSVSSIDEADPKKWLEIIEGALRQRKILVELSSNLIHLALIAYQHPEEALIVQRLAEKTCKAIRSANLIDDKIQTPAFNRFFKTVIANSFKEFIADPLNQKHPILAIVNYVQFAIGIEKRSLPEVIKTLLDNFNGVLLTLGIKSGITTSLRSEIEKIANKDSVKSLSILRTKITESELKAKPILQRLSDFIIWTGFTAVLYYNYFDLDWLNPYINGMSALIATMEFYNLARASYVKINNAYYEASYLKEMISQKESLLNCTVKSIKISFNKPLEQSSTKSPDYYFKFEVHSSSTESQAEPTSSYRYLMKNGYSIDDIKEFAGHSEIEESTRLETDNVQLTEKIFWANNLICQDDKNVTEFRGLFMGTKMFFYLQEDVVLSAMIKAKCDILFPRIKEVLASPKLARSVGDQGVTPLKPPIPATLNGKHVDLTHEVKLVGKGINGNVRIYCYTIPGKYPLIVGAIFDNAKHSQAEKKKVHEIPPLAVQSDKMEQQVQNK